MELYGSFINRVIESTNTTPKVGMGVTECLWSDREPYEITKVIDDRHIVVRHMNSECKDYFAGDWEVFSDPNGYEKKLFKTQKGVWRERIGRSLGCTKFSVGRAEKYEDPSF